MLVGEGNAEIGAKGKRNASFLALAGLGTHPGDGFAGTPSPPRGLLGEKDAQTFCPGHRRAERGADLERRSGVGDQREGLPLLPPQAWETRGLAWGQEADRKSVV